MRPYYQSRYHETGEKAKTKVLELLRGLSTELQSNINILVFASMLLVIAKALFSHVRFVNFYSCFLMVHCLFGKIR